MAKKKAKPTKNRRTTDFVPETTPQVPLDGKPWKGHDGAQWMDLAVDSSNPNVLLWLRKRLKNGQHFLVASCIGAHVLKTELTRTEALALFLQLPDRAPYAVCFPSKKQAASR